MSDSDTDLLPNNVLTFQTLGTTISARGPNINNTNLSSLSFRNNVMTSTMNMPWNMDRPRYAESVCDQRSMYYRRGRETSPMSFHSASGMPPQNLQRSYYPGTTSSHRSIYNGRSGSPISVRTIDSNTSINAKDIALAFQNGTFNKFDFKMIKDAYYNRYTKHRTRRRIEKRRNVKMFLKGFRRKSGGDSGDQASNSSISSDDCASIITSRSTIYKANMSSCRSTKTDISDFRRTMKENNIIRDCTENVRQNSFKTMLSQGRSRGKESGQNLHEKWQKESMAIREVKGVNAQKDRFKSSMLLPSQRFNHSTSPMTVSEKPNRLQIIDEENKLNIQNCVPSRNEKPDRQSQDTESEQEEIFANVTVMERNCSNSGKRIREEDDFLEPEKKRTKISPIKNKPNTPKQNKQPTKKQKSNDFVFAKPQLPVKKQTTSKPKLISSHKPNEIPHHEYKQLTIENMTSQSILQPTEKVISGSQKAIEELISKSTGPLEPSTENTSLQIHQEKEIPLSRDTTQHSATDMSMRPSFIKRKLFTQKVDVAEKNSSSDSLQADSPQTNVYSKIQKEKNRARKLVTSQSCLNRDVQDDSNLLDLIHKIVPADRMNVTTVTNRTEIQNNKSKPEKWDVTSLTTCDNSDDISDTFTDEEVIFAGDSEKQTKTLKYDEKQQDAEVIENIPIETKKKTIHDQKKKPIHKAKENYANKSIEARSRTINEQKKNLINEATKLKPANGKTNLNNGKQKVIYSKAGQQILETLNPTGCKVIIKKLQLNDPISTLNIPTLPSDKNDLVKTNIYKGIKSFWDTDAESDLDATPLKGKDPINTVTPNPEIVAKVLPLKNNVQLNKVGKECNVSNKMNEASKIKITANQTMTLSLKNKPKESKTINQSKKPTTNNQIVAENKKVESEVQSNKKTLPASLKENKPPHTESNKNASNNSMLSKIKLNENGKCSPEKKEETKKRVGRLQKNDKDMKLDKMKPQINNNNLTLNNKESHHIKVLNNTLRIRAQRKPKELKCCGEPDTSNNNSPVCRSLRSRLVDLSASLKSDDSDKKNKKKSAPKPKKSKVKTDDACKTGGDITSDVSFTLTTEALPAVNRTLRNRKTSATSKERTPSTSVSTRSKRNREIESLQNNAFLFGKRSAIDRTIALSRATNRISNNTRL